MNIWRYVLMILYKTDKNHAEIFSPCQKYIPILVRDNDSKNWTNVVEVSYQGVIELRTKH